jgi:hypothetical protein
MPKVANLGTNGAAHDVSVPNSAHATQTAIIILEHVNMGAAREPTQADFDLERFIDMFDEALTSNDERVINALRSLMMMVILTKSEVRHEGHDRNHGPLRQLFDDMHNLNRRMHQMEDRIREAQTYQQEKYKWDDLKKYSMQDVYSVTQTYPDISNLAKKINSGKI